MLTHTRLSSIFVLDQDEALDFYVGTLGLEVNTDADLGFMRWLTVNVPGDPDREIVGTSPSAFRAGDAPPPHDVPTCFTKAWTRPSSFGEAIAPAVG